MENKLVSIIVPIYNQEKYLEKSLKSILNQTYEKLEIILVNDGSTDKSINIIESYKNKDPRIKVVNKLNGGLSTAIIAGLEITSSDYTAFIDPDDYVGEDYIENFIRNVYESDIVAMGFYYDDNGKFNPYSLKKTGIIDVDEARKFIRDTGSSRINNLIFVSRWNKLYKTEILRYMLPELRNYQKVSIGEDSIFNALALAYSSKISVVSSPNSYFYNISNDNSMMKIEKAENINKIIFACQKLKEIYNNHDSIDMDQIQSLYYFLTRAEISKLYSFNYKVYKDKISKITTNKLYKDAIKNIKRESTAKEKYKLALKENSTINYVYQKNKEKFKILKSDVKFYLEEVKKFRFTNVKGSLINYKWNKNRKNAFKELKTKTPIIEKRIQQYLDSAIRNMKIGETSIEKNIFIFWWDGFDNAPYIVKKCRESVYKYYPDFNIIDIDKNNYNKYTELDKKIIEGFENNRISIQTFSDILRFNLLKCNGGMWIDATILFFSRVDLTAALEFQSFNSLEFSSSHTFFKYKEKQCSWSGYFIASVKNGEFVTLVDFIFQNYYLDYKEYTTYFFIDIVLMLCKLNEIEEGVLDKTLKIDHDMFLLAKVRNREYDELLMREIKRIPQKLSWKISEKKLGGNTFLSEILRGEEHDKFKG